MSERLQLDPITKTFIIQAGADLPLDGQSESIRCPFCEVLHENKFSVKRVDEGFVYNCFRGKCGASGFVRSDSAFYSPTQGNAKAKKSRSYSGVESLKKQTLLTFSFSLKLGVSLLFLVFMSQKRMSMLLRYAVRQAHVKGGTSDSRAGKTLGR